MHAHVPVLTAFASSLPPQAARLSFTSCCWVHMDVVVACALCQSKYPGPGKAFSAVADVSRGTSLGDNRADRGSALERPGPRGGKAASCKEAPCLGDESATAVVLSTEVLSVARALLLSRFSSERSEHPLVWGDGFLPSTALKYKGRWGVGRPTEGKLCARCSHP